MAAAPDHYLTLQVVPEADDEVIRAAYRVLARLYHPDMPTGSEWQMRRLNDAWAVLRDPARRRMYDRSRRSSVVPNGSASDVPYQPRRQPAAEDRLDFGQYTGWSIRELSRHDPEYLRWLIGTPRGRRFAAEAERALSDRDGRVAVLQRPRGSRRWGFR